MKKSSSFTYDIPIETLKDKRRIIQFTQWGNNIEIKLIDEFNKPQPSFLELHPEIFKKDTKREQFRFDPNFYKKIWDRMRYSALHRKYCGSLEITVPEGSDIVKSILEPFLKACSEDTDLLRTITENSPDLLNKISQHVSVEKKQKKLLEYESMLENEKLQEADWQKYFLNNRYILSNGLSTVNVLTPIHSQPSLGGLKIDGSGSQKADFLFASEGYFHFSHLGEIKKPQTPLFTISKKTCHPSHQLIQAISQLLEYIETWNIEGSRNSDDPVFYEGKPVYTSRPRGILVIGKLSEFKNNQKALTRFQSFRNNLKEIDIVTYDEIYQRLKFSLTTC